MDSMRVRMPVAPGRLRRHLHAVRAALAPPVKLRPFPSAAQLLVIASLVGPIAQSVELWTFNP